MLVGSSTPSPRPPAMSEPLTAAGLRLLEEVHGTTMALTVFPDRIRAIEAEAAARAVDEALSVERMSVEIDRHWLMDTPRGVGCTCQGWSLLLSEVPDEAGLGEHLLPFSAHIAAALVAHLRGPRPEGEG